VSKWILADKNALLFTAKDLAAAEERGRRAGIEEAAKCPDCGGALESFCSSDKCRDAAIKAWSLAPRKSAPAVAAHAFEPCHKGFDICAHRNRPDEFPCNRPRRDHAPRDSGTSCGADEDGIHREARRDRK
jgi:hypothetical protein